MASKPVRKEAPASSRAVRDLRTAVRALADITGKRVTRVEDHLASMQKKLDPPTADCREVPLARAERPSPASVDPTRPVIVELTDYLESLLARMDRVRNDLAAYNDARLGAAPEDSKSEANRPPRPGQAGNALDLVDAAHRFVARLEDQVQRLNAL